MGRQQCLRVATDWTAVVEVQTSVVLQDIVSDTYRLSPHLLRHAQWKVCEHGTVMRPVTAESMRSRHTGQVGNSYMFPWAASIREMVWETLSSTSMVTDRTCTI